MTFFLHGVCYYVQSVINYIQNIQHALSSTLNFVLQNVKKSVDLSFYCINN